MPLRAAAWLNRGPMPWRFALLAVLCSAPSLWCGLSIDDFAHVAKLRGLPLFGDDFRPSLDLFDFANGDPERMRRMMDLGIWPWWTLPELRTAFWRPLSALTHYLDEAFWPDAPFLMHAQSLCWLAVSVLLAALCYRRFLVPPGAAALAALFYAVSDIHALPAGWVANRNAEIALCFGLSALLLHDSGRHGHRAAAWLAPGALLLGLLSNEGAVGITAYLFAYACFLDSGPVRQRVLSLAPYAVVVVAWRLVYSWLGYGAWGSPAYLDPVATPGAFLAQVIVRGPVLLASLWLGPPAEVYMVCPPGLRTALLAWCAFVIAALLVLLAPLLRERSPRFFAAGMALSLLPACSTWPSDRLLLFAGLGGLGLIATLVHAVFARAAWYAGKAGQAVGRSAVVVLLAVHLVLSPVAVAVGVPIFHWILEDIERSAFAVPLHPADEDKTIIFSNVPSIFHPAYFSMLRSMAGQPIPERVRSIAPNAVGRTGLHVERTDAHTLVVAPQHGYPFLLLRDEAHPFAVGDRVVLSGLVVEILEMGERGVPVKVAYIFEVPLEDPSLLWLELRQGTYRPVSPPSPGETLVWHTDFPRWLSLPEYLQF